MPDVFTILGFVAKLKMIEHDMEACRRSFGTGGN
jgi:hypothetical protein